MNCHCNMKRRNFIKGILALATIPLGVKSSRNNKLSGGEPIVVPLLYSNNLKLKASCEIKKGDFVFIENYRSVMTLNGDTYKNGLYISAGLANKDFKKGDTVQWNLKGNSEDIITNGIASANTEMS